MPSVESRNILLGTVSKHCAWHSTAQCCNCKGLEEEKGKLVCSSLQGYDGRLRLSRSGRPERESQAQAGKGTAPLTAHPCGARHRYVRAHVQAKAFNSPRRHARPPDSPPGHQARVRRMTMTCRSTDRSLRRPPLHLLLLACSLGLSATRQQYFSLTTN
jgi:hypothetical protein